MQQKPVIIHSSSFDAEVEVASGPNDRVFLLKLILYVTLVSLGFYLIPHSEGFIKLAAVILVGSMFAHGVELSHQLLHGTGFKSMRVSNVVGTVLCAPMLISYRSYQLCHLRHHAFLGTKDDTEFFDFNMLDDNVSWHCKFLSFTMIKHYLTFFHRSRKALVGEPLFDFLPENLDKQCRNQYLFLFTAVVFTAALSLFWENSIVTYLWITPLLFVAGPLHTIIELPEHSGCDKSTQSVFENTRSIKSNALMTWFVNGNNYHVEHHEYPSVRPEFSARLHEHIKPLIKNKSTSYREFIYRAFVESRTKRNRFFYE